MKKSKAEFRNKLMRTYREKEFSVRPLEQTGIVMRNLKQEEKEEVAKEILEEIEDLTDEEEVLKVIKNIR